LHFVRRTSLLPLLRHSLSGSLFGLYHPQKNEPCSIAPKLPHWTVPTDWYKKLFFLDDPCCRESFPKRNGVFYTKYPSEALESWRSIAIHLFQVRKSRQCKWYFLCRSVLQNLKSGRYCR